MSTIRTAYKYHFKKGNKIIRTGVTGNILLLESELQREYGGGHIKQVGLRTTPEEAFVWEEEQRRQGKPVKVERTMRDIVLEWETEQRKETKQDKKGFLLVHKFL